MANEDLLYQNLGANGIAEKVTIRSGGGIEPYIGTTLGNNDGWSGYNTIQTANYPANFNGINWDRKRNNIEATLLASAARTVTTSSPDQTNYNGKGVHVFLNVSAIGTGSVTLTIEEKDPVSGLYVPILVGVAVVANGIIVYKVYPGLTAAANSVADDVIPRTWRVTVTANNVNPVTYSVSSSTIL